MKREEDNRHRLLKALLQHADEPGKFNPHFHRKEMLQRLALSEGEFNIIQKQLGEKYCHYVDQHNGDARYAITVSECLALRDQLRNDKTQEKSHKQLVRVAVLVAVLGAVLATAFTVWLQRK